MVNEPWFVKSGPDDSGYLRGGVLLHMHAPTHMQKHLEVW